MMKMVVVVASALMVVGCGTADATPSAPAEVLCVVGTDGAAVGVVSTRSDLPPATSVVAAGTATISYEAGPDAAWIQLDQWTMTGYGRLRTIVGVFDAEMWLVPRSFSEQGRISVRTVGDRALVYEAWGLTDDTQLVSDVASDVHYEAEACVIHTRCGTQAALTLVVTIDGQTARVGAGQSAVVGAYRVVNGESVRLGDDWHCTDSPAYYYAGAIIAEP